MRTHAGFAVLVLALLIPTQVALAATVAMTQTPSVVRTQVQGNGTYDVYDFFWTNAAGAQFTNYTFEAIATTGSFRDPARLQDDRQTTPDPGSQNGNTAGAVDTWMNTVMSAAAKVDGGFTATILADPAGYVPTGSGASPGFTYMKWDVFDTEPDDDNNLSDHPDGPFSSAAPYHLARLVATPGTTGGITISAYDTSQPGVPNIFTFGPVPFNTPPSVDPEIPQNAMAGDIITTQFSATDLTPHPPIAFRNAVLASFIPLRPFGSNPSFNGVVEDNGNFTWDTTGFRAGAYTINVTATETFPISNSSTGGQFVVTIFVPEPSSLTLVAVAILGTFGAIRRRSS